MSFVAYRVCRLMNFVVPYSVCRLMTFIAYRVCCLMTFVAYRVCRLMTFVAYIVCRFMTFIAERVFMSIAFRDCRSANTVYHLYISGTDGVEVGVSLVIAEVGSRLQPTLPQIHRRHQGLDTLQQDPT